VSESAAAAQANQAAADSDTLRQIADHTGLTAALVGHALPRRLHSGRDRGRVLTDAAVMMAGAAARCAPSACCAASKTQSGRWPPRRPVRALTEIDVCHLDRIDDARAAVRERVWTTGGLGDTIVLRIDAHLLDTVSRKNTPAGSSGRDLRPRRRVRGRPAPARKLRRDATGAFLYGWLLCAEEAGWRSAGELLVPGLSERDLAVEIAAERRGTGLLCPDPERFGRAVRRRMRRPRHYRAVYG
jgi:hypothetical protein